MMTISFINLDERLPRSEISFETSLACAVAAIANSYALTLAEVQNPVSERASHADARTMAMAFCWENWGPKMWGRIAAFFETHETTLAAAFVEAERRTREDAEYAQTRRLVYAMAGSHLS